jgi:hypothetical protein
MVNLRYLPKHPIFSWWMYILPLIAEDQSTSSGWWYTYPSEKYESQLGWWHSQYIIPNWMESHKIPWFQTANQQSWPRFWEPSCPKYQGPRLGVRRAGPLWVWPRSCTIFRTYTWSGDAKRVDFTNMTQVLMVKLQICLGKSCSIPISVG